MQTWGRGQKSENFAKSLMEAPEGKNRSATATANSAKYGEKERERGRERVRDREREKGREGAFFIPEHAFVQSAVGKEETEKCLLRNLEPDNARRSRYRCFKPGEEGRRCTRRCSCWRGQGLSHTSKLDQFLKFLQKYPEILKNVSKNPQKSNFPIPSTSAAGLLARNLVLT